MHDVAQVDADTPARFNADPSRLFEASGSAGKVCVACSNAIGSLFFQAMTGTLEDHT